MERIGDLLPEAARELGLEAELRLARATSTWTAIVAERVPAAGGASRLVGIDDGALLVEADHPIVAQELRLRSGELLEVFGSSPGGFRASGLRVRMRRV